MTASSSPMLNALEGVRSDPAARRFDIGEVLFAQFSCPAGEIGLWSQRDVMMHVLSGTLTWRVATGEGDVAPGETVFVKKGAYVLGQRPSDDLCVQFYFVPDGVVRETVLQLSQDLPAAGEAIAAQELVFRVKPEAALSAFFDAMRVYFAADEDPPEPLLKLKLAELLTGILLSRTNPALSAYLMSLATCEAPPIPAIMEANYHHNLPLLAFAQMCHRSLSTFKRDFRKHYKTSPRRWLLERRLARSVSLLQATRLSVTEIMLECGFEDLSHFSRAFKEKFGQPPSLYRAG